MGTSKKWLKAIVSRKKSPQAKNADSEAAPNKKQSSWNLWKSCHIIDQGSTLGGDDDDETSVENGIGVSSSTPRIIINQADREEWAAICIQTAFRGVLARRALRALKGLVRLQAAINGQCVHKQSNGSLRSIQAFVRVRARIHAHRVLKNKEGQGVPQTISCNTVEAGPVETEEGWCDSIGTVQEIQARLQQRQEAAIKRERAMAYAFSNQWRANSKLNIESLFDHELDNSTWSWIWLDHWISSQPSEGHFSNPNSKQDAQTVEDGTGNNFRLKNSASLGTKKAANSKVNLDTSKGNHSALARARSRSNGTDSRLQKAPSSLVSKPYAKKQAPKPSVEQSSRQWRSFSNPKQWPNTNMKRRNSLPIPVQKSATLQKHQSAVRDHGSHYMLDPEEDRKEDTIEIRDPTTSLTCCEEL